MKVLQRGELFGLYKGDPVTVTGLPDDPRNMNAECEVEFCASVEPDKKTVRWGDVQDLSGSGRHPPWLEAH
jgi:hypothetical protein